MKEIKEIDCKAYKLAKAYLAGLNIPNVTMSLIERYLDPRNLPSKPNTKKQLYRRILVSAQNANMKPGVIGKAIGGVDKLSSVLFDFNPREVLLHYDDDWEAILDKITVELKPRGQVRRTSRALWPKYCQTILSAASFVEQFESIEDFFEWVDFFYKDSRARASLPLLLSKEIEGFGFALSCDFLKEQGYVNFPKPDVHLRDIFTALKLCDDKSDDYKLFKAVVRLASNAQVTPYNADKLFWLIGSGNFYDDPKIGKKGKIGSRKKDFIQYAQKELYGEM